MNQEISEQKKPKGRILSSYRVNYWEITLIMITVFLVGIIVTHYIGRSQISSDNFKYLLFIVLVIIPISLFNRLWLKKRVIGLLGEALSLFFLSLIFFTAFAFLFFRVRFSDLSVILSFSFLVSLIGTLYTIVKRYIIYKIKGVMNP